ncbi:MAG: MFS transporter, partial [Patescibacteria group bacterium]
SLPLLLNKKIFEISQSVPDTDSIQGQSLKSLFNSIFSIPALALFMTSFFLFSDAITTLVNNFSIFMSSLFHVSDSRISILTLLVIISAGIGALVYGYFSDKIGSQKTLLWSLISWVIIIPVISFSTNYSVFFVFSVITGFFIGATFAVSRKVLIELVPSDRLNYFFGIYAISERAATIVGPLLWTAVLAMGGYRWAMFSMVIFQVISVILMRKVIKIRKSGTI